MNNKKVFDFIGYRKVLFLIPIVIAVITVIFNCIFGIEMAIEFKGGTMLTYSYTGEIDTNAVKKTVEGRKLRCCYGNYRFFDEQLAFGSH